MSEQESKDVTSDESGSSDGETYSPDYSVTEGLKHPVAKNELKTIFSFYALLGAGVGLTAYIMLGQLTGGTGGAVLSGVTAFLTVFILAIVGPIVAAFVGIHSKQSLDRPPRDEYAIVVLGTYCGFLIMAFIATLVMSLQFGGPLADGGSAGEATFNLTDYVMPFILSGLPSAVTGGGAAYVLNTFGMWE